MLRDNFVKWKFLDNSKFWWVNVRDYIANAIDLANNIMEQKGKMFVYVKQSKRKMLIIYRPELYVSLVLNPKETQEYQWFIGIARWIIELGRVDILCEVSLLSSHLVMPQKLHMEALMGILFYIENSYGKTIVVDAIIPKVDTLMVIETNWLKIIYDEDTQEEILANTPEPLGKPI